MRAGALRRGAAPARALAPRALKTPAARRGRAVAVRLSHYSAAFYDLQAQRPLDALDSLAPQQLAHLVHGAAAGGLSASGALYLATFCALSVTLGALFYSLTSVLNEYFDLQARLTSRPQERPTLHGVDVSRSAMFTGSARVRAAADFAAAAHAGQRRKTGEPYVRHCIETALIVEANLPHWRHDSRHEDAVIAALLHDTLDDTPTTPEAIGAAYGPAVAAMVVKVSKLSQVNQMLRRDKRKGVVSGDPGFWASQWGRLKRMMFEAVVEEPLVILVKLADRLHNMRTVYALPPAKQQAVAEETLAVWCSMAASLGWHGLKARRAARPGAARRAPARRGAARPPTLPRPRAAPPPRCRVAQSEMEDLCFAVVQPARYCALRQELDKLWSSPPPPRSRRRVRATRRAAQLAALAQAQAALDEARAEARAEPGGALGRGLRGLRARLWGPPPARGGGGGAQQQQLDAGQLQAVAERAQDGSAVAAAGSAGSQQQALQAQAQQQQLLQQQPQQQAAGLNLLSRAWQSAAAPLLPAPPEPDGTDPQRPGGGEWGVTDAALSLRALLGAGRAPGAADGGVAAAAAGGAQPAPAPPGGAAALTAQQQQLRAVLSTVVPFDAVSLRGSRGLTWSARQGLSVLEEAAGRLYTELAVGSFSCGLGVEIQGRLKSLRSVNAKMERKACSVEEVYDARALRVVVDDAGGTRLADAVQCCYRLVGAVHKLWYPIHGEFDDYVANPKPSGYQALHTAVWGPGGAALEVQIKTSGMHEHAEYGGAAHWAYKEVLWGSPPAAAAAVNALEGAPLGAPGGAAGGAPGRYSRQAEAGGAASAAAVEALPTLLFSFDDDGRLLSSSQLAAAGGGGLGGGLLELAEPAAPGGAGGERGGRVLVAAAPAGAAVATAARAAAAAPGAQQAPAQAGGEAPLRARIAALSQQAAAAAAPEAQPAGGALLCVIMSGGTNPEHPWRMPDYGFYAQLLGYAGAAGWTAPGQGDWHARLEEYEWCRDGRCGGAADPARRGARPRRAAQPLRAAAHARPAAPARRARWHRRDHMGYLHPHTTLTLLEGYERDAAEAAARGSGAEAAAPAPAPAPAAPLAAAREARAGGGEPPAGLAGGPGAAAGAAAGLGAGSDWAATAAKAAQLRSVIEWGMEAYGVPTAAEQGGDVSVVIWPGGVIEDVPRGTTAGQILRERGVLAILDAPDGAAPAAAAAAASAGGGAERAEGGGDASAPGRLVNVVNVNNRLVSEDTVLSDGDLVILARERIKI
ncbi:relA [Scenedesmus sp. PABB004]|nr:relA [Scenedesmus sp. PABB004]